MSDLWADTAVNWGGAHSWEKGHCVLAGISWLAMAPSAPGERDVGMPTVKSSKEMGLWVIFGPSTRSQEHWLPHQMCLERQAPSLS